MPSAHTPLDSPASSSSAESGSEEEENDAGDDLTKLQEMEMAVGTGLTPEDISKAKQSKSEKKARKFMMKLGLKSYTGEWVCHSIV